MLASPQGAAASSVSYTSTPTDAIQLSQGTLIEAADVINKEVLAHQYAGEYAGFVNLGLGDQWIDLWWQGDVPAEARAVITAAERIAPVRVHPARYSRAELDAAVERIGAVMEATEGGDVHTVSALGDGSGVRVSRVPGGQMTASSHVALPDVNVAVFEVEEPRLGLLTRLDDGSPWWGGARIEAWRNGSRRSQCTSGWAVGDGYGHEWLLTAAHCGTYPDQFRDPTGQVIGPVGREQWDRDILLITTSAQGAIYDGPVSGAWMRSVTDWMDPYTGLGVCQSGSFSGTVCSIFVTNEFNVRLCDYDSDGDWTCASGLVKATRSSGTAVQGGDSGGPVYVTSGSGVAAVGTVTGGGGNVLLFQDFREAATYFGVAPLIYPN